jgi:hypothetical protein
MSEVVSVTLARNHPVCVERRIEFWKVADNFLDEFIVAARPFGVRVWHIERRIDNGRTGLSEVGVLDYAWNFDGRIVDVHPKVLT